MLVVSISLQVRGLEASFKDLWSDVGSLCEQRP